MSVDSEARCEGSVTKEIGKRMGGLGRYEPMLAVAKIPRCPTCGGANPEARAHCPCCGDNAPPVTETRYETSIATNIDGLFPWHARLLLAIGAWLRRIAQRLKGE